MDTRPGEDVVRQGDVADALYVIYSGTLKVMSRRQDNDQIELASLGPGDYFGEIGLLQGIPRTATVTATSPGRLLRIAGPAFLQAVSSGRSFTVAAGGCPSPPGEQPRLSGHRHLPRRRVADMVLR